MTQAAFRQQVNEWGRLGVPFLFIVDFELKKPLLWDLRTNPGPPVRFNFRGKGNDLRQARSNCTLNIAKPGRAAFDEQFALVMQHLTRGDSYLLNLTVKSEIVSSVNFEAVYAQAKAPYKMWLPGQFLFFSPEPFVTIAEGKIKTFPMKGTIDAAIEAAAAKILANQKEMAEHVTIVDLLRNDLARVARDVKVARFRYLEEIKTATKTLLQVSSEIEGTLPTDYQHRLGDILFELLPAGSISGAPKQKTVEIIQQAEGTDRGYYTGVAGYFDGETLDTCVAIRFIEQEGARFFYRSGAGITTQSEAAMEYQEMLDKVYVPID